MEDYMDFDAITSSEIDKAFSLRNDIEGSYFEANPHGIRSTEAFAEYIRPRTLTVTLLAGSGSRWVRSVKKARSEGEPAAFDLSKPRGLYPVENVMGSGTIPVAAYSLNAVRGLGTHCIVTRGFDREIESEILEPLGIDKSDYVFRHQDDYGAKPLGHGDAAWQVRDLFDDYDYVLFNFGGDANSPATARRTLMVFDMLKTGGVDCGLLMPAAWIKSPAYIIETDASGLPTRFGHNKLTSKQSAAADGYCNVGVRLYDSVVLKRQLEDVRREYYTPGKGYDIPGNESGEFALDNVDMRLASMRKARILPVALPQEITPAKSWYDIPRFVEAVKTIQGP